MVKYLTKKDIFLINKKTVERHGGNFVPPNNLLNSAALDYLVEMVQSDLYYPELPKKAALYLFNINGNHVFQDGNKRTGLASFLIFLNLNGYALKDQLSQISTPSVDSLPQNGNSTNEILEEFIMEVAAGKIDFEGCQQWIEHNMEHLA